MKLNTKERWTVRAAQQPDGAILSEPTLARGPVMHCAGGIAIAKPFSVALQTICVTMQLLSLQNAKRRLVVLAVCV